MINDNNVLMTNDNDLMKEAIKRFIVGNSNVILTDLVETCAEMLIENGVCSCEAFNQKLDKKLLKDFGAENFAIIKQATALMKRGVNS